MELLTLRENTPKFTILLTSRHHAGETMATHAMEGFLRAVLADDRFGRTFRQHVAVFAVPFVNKDGVEEGDQGKNRVPHDHARDDQPPGIYPETIALRALLLREKPAFVLDLHCPWLRGNSNETSYMVGIGIARMDHEMERFADQLEAERVPQAPYFKQNNIPFGTSWNTAQNYTQGRTFVEHRAKLHTGQNDQTLCRRTALRAQRPDDRNPLCQLRRDHRGPQLHARLRCIHRARGLSLPPAGTGKPDSGTGRDGEITAFLLLLPGAGNMIRHRNGGVPPDSASSLLRRSMPSLRRIRGAERTIGPVP